MEKTEVVSTSRFHSEVRLFSHDVQVGQMNIVMKDGKLAVFHTEVYPGYKGRGFAQLLLDQLVSYARENEFKIIPLCPYVHLQFRKHPVEYDDVWSNDWHQ